jgi:Putative zinc- or iron-chelating domain
MNSTTTIYKAPDQLTRRCGDCSLCCKLLPMQSVNRQQVSRLTNQMIGMGMAKPSEFAGMVQDFYKPAGERCPHQRHGKGCAVYARRPFGCRMWNCRWLLNDDTADLRRPDRTHYVVDCMPDFVTLSDDTTGEQRNLEVVQIWIDPDYRDAWRRDPALLAFIERRAKEGIAALIRHNSREATAVFAPPLAADGQWHEKTGGQPEPQHMGDELLDGLARAQRSNVKIGSSS